MILDVAGEHLEAVYLAGKLRGERTECGISCFGHMLCRACGIRAGHAMDAVLAQEIAALAEKNGMAHGTLDPLKRGARQGEKIDMHPHEGFIDDMQSRFRQEAVDIRHPAVDRIFDRQHGQLGIALAHRLDRIFEGAAGHRLHAGIGLEAGLVGIGAGLSLEGYAAVHVSGSGSSRKRDRNM